MNIIVFKKEFEIHTTPLEKIFSDPYSISIEVDDINETRHRLIFKPYVAYRVTSIDCVSSKDFYNDYCFRDGRYHRHILKVENSEWINDLKSKTGKLNGSFLNQVNHYVLPLQDIVIEVLANDIVVQIIKS